MAPKDSRRQIRIRSTSRARLSPPGRVATMLAVSDAGRTMREERRFVTALFADLAGSTQLAERLEPEELKLVVGDAIARIVGAVEAFGGTVKDLAGDGVLALFGAPVAHEDDPERALLAALRIVEEIGEFAGEVRQGWGIDGFGVRVGVESGPVVVGAVGAGSRVEYGATGDAVNVASRLQSHAEPGAVLVGLGTAERVEALFAWGPPATFDLKGKAEPVTARHLVAPTSAPGRVRGFEGVQAPLVGRERELETIGDLANTALAGAGAILVVTGEPGIGKSRLISELRRTFESGRAQRGRPLWIEGSCVSYGESMTYWLIRALLRSWLGTQADEPEMRVRVALRRGIERLFADRTAEIYPYLAAMLGLSLEPDARDRLAELSPEALQYRTFEVVRHWLQRLAEDGPVAVALEDLHWADPTSLQLLQRLLPDTEEAALLLVLTLRRERDHPAWRLTEDAARELPHRTTELPLEALSGDAGLDLLRSLVGAGTLSEEMEGRILDHAEGNPFFLEELVRSLVDAGSLTREGDGWRFDHETEVEIPPTVEKVILARIDRLEAHPRDVLTAASVLGREFGLPLLEAVSGDGDVRGSLLSLMRLDLLREARRWPEPEYRFKHALIQEAAYRTLVVGERRALHAKAARWLESSYAGREDEVAGLLAHHWLAAADEDKAVAYLTRAGDRARQEYALDEAIAHYRELLPILGRRGERDAIALVLFKLALAFHMSLRFSEADEMYQRAFDFWSYPAPSAAPPTGRLRIATSFLPNDPDPRSAIAWPNIQLCMQLFDRLVEAWPERTIVPSLAERWEISDDGLRYTFHLREGLTWSDGEPLTAHDIEFGIKRVLNPDAPGSSVAIYFVLEHGQDHYLRTTDDPDLIGVRALDDRTLEFRLAAPAPYFMSVMNRPDAGPQPRHAIERLGDGWTEVGKQVVSGAFEIVDRSADTLVLRRRPRSGTPRPGNVATVTYMRREIPEALAEYERDELDAITVRYTPKVADLVPGVEADAHIGPASWSGYLAFRHADPVIGNVEVRRALAHAVDRERLAAHVPSNLVVANGGIVPPALQGHTPDIAPKFDPDAAREHLRRSGLSEAELRGIQLAGIETWLHDFLLVVAETWRDVLGIDVPVRPWTLDQALSLGDPTEMAPIVITGWLPGYADPEYYLRLLFQSDSKTNYGGFSDPEFDRLIERARQERSDRSRLELFHEADRMAVADRIACIPLVYGRSMAFVKPWVHGWWEFGKSSSFFADLDVTASGPGSGGG
jgi:ABC-type oligopeptide transport system substrate-binding subunit/class 3 adenylate cyclase